MILGIRIRNNLAIYSDKVGITVKVKLITTWLVWKALSLQPVRELSNANLHAVHI